MNNEHPRSNTNAPPVSRKRKIDTNTLSTSNTPIQAAHPLQPVALNSSTLHLTHLNASILPPSVTLESPHPTRPHGPFAQPYWANYGHRTILGNKRTMVHSAPAETASPNLSSSAPYGASMEGTLLPTADIDLSPNSKRARLVTSLPHTGSLRGPSDPLPAPLPTTSACLPRHLKAFARLAPRPRAHIIVADVHRMGRVAVHADVFTQIVEAEEQVMGPGAARTRRACRRERTRSASGVHSHRYSIDSTATQASNGSFSTLPSNVTPEVEELSEIAAPWPDSQYPWSFTSLQLEDKRVRSRHAELAHVERWLETADEEPEGGEEPAWNTSGSALEGGLPSLSEMTEFSKGHIANPSLSDSVASDEDDADARNALLARASVQDFIARRTARAVLQHTPSGDVVRCICMAGADGRPMIQCTDCRTWSHRICMDAPGVGSRWRCWRCAPSIAAPERVFQPTFVPNTTPSRRIVVPPPPPARAVQWQPSPLLPSVPLPETPERTVPFPFHSFITPRFFADFARRDTDDEGDIDMADGSPRRQRLYSPIQPPRELDQSPSTPLPIQSNATTTPMTPERGTGPRPQPQHSGSTAADSAGPASPMVANTGEGVVGVYAGEDSPVRQRRAHRAWQLGANANPKGPSDMGARRGDAVPS